MGLCSHDPNLGCYFELGFLRCSSLNLTLYNIGIISVILIVFVLLFYVVWRTQTSFADLKSCDKAEIVSKEYRGTLLQLVSIKSNKEIYEICFQLKVTSYLWNRKKHIYTRGQFEALLDCLDKGAAGRFDSPNGRVIEVVSSHDSGESLLHLSTPLSWQQYTLEKSITNAIRSDLKDNVI